MRVTLFPVALFGLLLTSCGAGSFGIGFDHDISVKTAAGSTATVAGHFDTAGAYNGKYTLVITPKESADSCMLSVKDGGSGTSVSVDTSDGDEKFDLTVTIQVNAAATLSAACNVKATKDDDPNTSTNADAVVYVE